jgi:hypothetical protein
MELEIYINQEMKRWKGDEDIIMEKKWDGRRYFMQTDSDRLFFSTSCYNQQT